MAFEYRGLWNDGQTAARQTVRVRLDSNQLLILDQAGRERLAEWSFSELSLAEEVYANQPSRFRHPSMPDARLIVDDPALIDDLQEHAPQLKKRNFVAGTAMRRILVWGSAAVGLIIALYIGIPKLAGPIASVMPRGWEEQLGRSVVNSELDGRTICDSREAKQAMDQLLAKLSQRYFDDWSFRVRIVKDEMVNAFAAPGGEMVIYSGLIDAADSGDEVAAVLAHEMAHVIHRHGTESIVRRLGLSLVTAIAFGDGSGAILASGGQLMLELSHGRDAESEADATGLSLLADARINGSGMAGFFSRLAEGEQAGDIPALLSTHPQSEQRARAASEQAKPGAAAFTDSQWDALRNACDISYVFNSDSESVSRSR